MTKLLSKEKFKVWVQLFHKYKYEEFTRQDVYEFIQGMSRTMRSVVINELYVSGWITARVHKTKVSQQMLKCQDIDFIIMNMKVKE